MSQDPRTTAPVSDSSWTSGEDVVAHGHSHLDDDKGPVRAFPPADGTDDVEGHVRAFDTDSDALGSSAPVRAFPPADGADDVEGHVRAFDTDGDAEAPFRAL